MNERLRARFESIQRPNATEIKSEILSMSTCVSICCYLRFSSICYDHNTHFMPMHVCVYVVDVVVAAAVVVVVERLCV